MRTQAVESWDDVDCPARGKAVLKDNGITPSVGNCLVHMLGYTEPEDLQHVTEALLGKLPLKPLEKARLLKLVESQKGAGGGAARPPSARFSSKTAAASSSATTSSGRCIACKHPRYSANPYAASHGRCLPAQGRERVLIVG